MHDLPLVVAELPIGQSATVTVWRRMVALSLQPMIGEMPTNPAVAEIGHGENDGRQARGTIDPLRASASFPSI